MYFILSYTVIFFYLFIVFVKIPVISTWFNNAFFNTKFLILINRIIYTMNISMGWSMFSVSPPLYNRIKIIIETHDKEITVFYLEEDKIQKIIPELKLSISCQSILINNYSYFSDFMNDFFKKRFQEIYNNIKYIQIYKLVYNSQLVRNCINFDKNKSKLIFSHEYK